MANKEMSEPSRAESGFFYGYVIVAVSTLMLVVLWGTYYAFGVFFKPVLGEFGWTRAMVSGAFSLAMILHGLISIPVGGLNDRFGPRIVMTVCGLVLGLGYCLMSQISAPWLLYLFFGVIIGIGMGASFIPMVSTVARWFVKKRGMMTGIVTAGIGIGALVGPPAASRLISAFGWRTSYVIIGIVVFAVVVISGQLLRRDPAQMGIPPYGGNQSEHPKIRTQTAELSLREGVRTRNFWLLAGMFFCFGFCLHSIMVHIVPHAIELRISVARAADIMAIIGGVSIAGKVLMGRAGDTIGSRQAILIGFVLILAAFLWLITAKTLWSLYLFAAVFGFAYGASVSSHSPLIAELFGLSSHGLILAVAGAGVLVGGALGPLLTGYIFDVNGSYRLAFLICSVMGTLGLILTALVKPISVKRLRDD